MDRVGELFVLCGKTELGKNSPRKPLGEQGEGCLSLSCKNLFLKKKITTKKQNPTKPRVSFVSGGKTANLTGQNPTNAGSPSSLRTVLIPIQQSNKRKQMTEVTPPPSPTVGGAKHPAVGVL